MKKIIIKIVILYFMNYIRKIYKIKQFNIDNKKQFKSITLKNKYKNVMLESLSALHEIFKHLNIIYFVSNDLLLSYIKDNKITPDINKIDIYIQKNTFDKNKLIPYLENNELELNMNIINNTINSLKLNNHIRYRINIHLHFFEIKENKIYYITNDFFNLKKEICDKDKIFPLQTVRAYKIDMFIPFDYDNILKYNMKDKININYIIQDKININKGLLQNIINIIK